MCYYVNERIEKKGKVQKMKDVILLSKYVINKFNNDDAPITNLKLQKVLYYIQGYFCREFGHFAFDDDIYCWKYGPVVPSVYYEFNFNGAQQLVCKSVNLCLTEIEIKLIDNIICHCKSLSSSQLVEKTHHESPWDNTSIGNIIAKNEIVDFFSTNNPLEIHI